jgi:hypothetical protein
VAKIRKWQGKLRGCQNVKVSDSMLTLCRVSELKADFMEKPLPGKEEWLFSLIREGGLF